MSTAADAGDPPSPLPYTAAMIRIMPNDGRRYEVVHGELLVTPPPDPWHEEVAGRLLARLREYLRAEGVGSAFDSPSEICWGQFTLVQPDIFVIPPGQARTLNWSAMTTLLLVAEILSPASARADRIIKRMEYQRQRVPLYWIVNPEERNVEIWTPKDLMPTFEYDRLVWHPRGALRPFFLSLVELFHPV